MKIGVLSLQGNYQNHINCLKKLRIDTKKVKYENDLKSIDALILPGGESSTISNLIRKQKL